MHASDREFQAALDALLVRMNSAAPRAITRIGDLIIAKTMNRAPVRQGTLRRSVHMDGPFLVSEGVWSARVGPSTVYARRIELGFMNRRDSLGRLYHQRAKPYFLPSVAEVRPLIGRIYRDTFAASQKG